MGSYILGEPIGSPMQYDPSFKVEACLHEPLWCTTESSCEIALDLITLCAQLDLHCQRELAHHRLGKIDDGDVGTIFETKAVMLLEKMKTSAQKMAQPPPSVKAYLDQSGLGKLYPRAAAYVEHPRSFSLPYKSTLMDGYFDQMANLHQVGSIATQINNDVTALTNHKYLAHQLALLHQSLAVFNTYKPLVLLRKNIESNFGSMKQALTQHEDEDGELLPRLPAEHAQWVLDVTRAIVNEISSIPADLTPSSSHPAFLLCQV